MIFSRQGMACRFEASEDQVRSMGRAARGVIGIRLREGDEVVGMEIVAPGDDILNITERGMGKRSNVGTGIAEEDVEIGGGYRRTKRGSKGVTSIKLRDGDLLLSALRVEEGDEIIMTSQVGQVVRISVDDIRTIGRSSQGVRIINLTDKDVLASVSRIQKMEGDEEEELDENGQPIQSAAAAIPVDSEVVEESAAEVEDEDATDEDE
jgi:DNA gyrase subunit A